MTGRFRGFWCNVLVTARAIMAVKDFGLETLEFDFQYPDNLPSDRALIKGQYVNLGDLQKYVVQRLYENKGLSLLKTVLRRHLQDLLPPVITVKSIRIPITEALSYDHQNFEIPCDDIRTISIQTLLGGKGLEIKIMTATKEHRFIVWDEDPETLTHIITILKSVFTTQVQVLK